MKNFLKNTPAEVTLKAGMSFYKFLDKPRGKCKRDDSVLLSAILWAVILGIIPIIQHLSK